MKTNYEIRYAAHPEDAKSYDTQRIRRDFLIEKVFAADEVRKKYVGDEIYLRALIEFSNICSNN